MTIIQLLSLQLGFHVKFRIKKFGKRNITPMFIATLFIIAKTWKPPKCPSTDEWIKKMWHIYVLYIIYI